MHILHVSLFEYFRKTCIKPDYEQKRNFAAVLDKEKYLQESSRNQKNQKYQCFVIIERIQQQS